VTRRRLIAIGLPGLLLVTAAGLAGWRVTNDGDAPPLSGRLVYVSDAGGRGGLVLRQLDTGEERTLPSSGESERDPACAPDGRRVAFSMDGRIGVVDVSSGELRVLTLGVDWLDGQPDWRGDGRALVVASRRQRDAPADLHELDLESDPRAPMGVTRRVLTQTDGLDEESPVYSYDGSFVVFVRQDGLYRLDLNDHRPSRRLTSGFKRYRAPRLLPDGAFIAPWSLDKTHGIDVISGEGEILKTLCEGSIYYEDVAPSPDGRFLAATFGFDLSFTLRDALRPRNSREIRVIDDEGRARGTLVASWRNAYHSPCWLR